ncbi:MAG TPA: shikimate kinase, partial [Pirellulales bacterium]
EGKTLAQLIEAHGMQEFLQIEGRHVRSIAGDGLLVSPGGSVVYVPETMEYLQKLGTIVYLDLPLPELEQRLGDLAARGVAIAPDMTLADLFNEREPLYKKYAAISVPCSRRSAEDVAQAVVAKLSQR